MEASTDTPSDLDVADEGETLPKSDEDAPQLSLFPGGPDPTKSILSLKTGKKEISNELERGQEVALLVHARVEEVHFAAETRKHVLSVVDIFEYDTQGADVGQALMSDTGTPFPPEEDIPEEEVSDAEVVPEGDAGGDVSWD